MSRRSLMAKGAPLAPIPAEFKGVDWGMEAQRRAAVERAAEADRLERKRLRDAALLEVEFVILLAGMAALTATFPGLVLTIWRAIAEMVAAGFAW